MKGPGWFGFLLLLCMECAGQKEAAVWYFGVKAGLNFNFSPPVPLTDSKMTTLEGCSSIADSAGSLLFYTDGRTIWNRFHDTMPNGTGLFGDESSTHSSVILRHSQRPDYFVITADRWNKSPQMGICYSRVDPDINNGLGAVLEKNVRIVDASAEKIAAFTHANGRDIWVVAARLNTDSLYAFLLTASELDTMNKVVSRIGTPVSSGFGQMKFSVSGKTLAFTNAQTGETVVMDFDRHTGIIYNPRTIGSFGKAYGLEFSPDSRFMYVGEWQGPGAKLYQCPVPVTSTNATSQCISVASATSALFGQLQLGPDMQIYIGRNSDGALDVIHSPDSAGAACRYEARGQLLGGKTSQIGLPTFVQSVFSSGKVVKGAVLEGCAGDTITVRVFPGPGVPSFDSIHWHVDSLPDFFEGTVSHERNLVSGHKGSFTINAIVFRDGFSDTSTSHVSVIGKPVVELGNDTTLCSGDSLRLDVTGKGTSFTWHDSSTGPAFIAKVGGRYRVRVSIGPCSSGDSVTIAFAQRPHPFLGNDTILCPSDTIRLDVTEAGCTYEWSDHDAVGAKLVSYPGGTYSVKVSRDGCSASDDVLVTYRNIPGVSLGPDTALCNGTVFVLHALADDASCLWQDGSTGSLYAVSQAGTYWVHVLNPCGETTDTVNVKVSECSCDVFVPDAFSPNGDRVNDVFEARSGCTLYDFSMTIYNRWGQRIFASGIPSEGWDGTYEGRACTTDAYVYLIDFRQISQTTGKSERKLLKGRLMLLR